MVLRGGEFLAVMAVDFDVDCYYKKKCSFIKTWYKIKNNDFVVSKEKIR